MSIKVKEEVFEILEACKSLSSDFLENEQLEFKNFNSEKSLHNSKELPGEISALANYKGGKVIIGVKDGSEIKDKNYIDQLHGFPEVDLSVTIERIKGKIQPKIDIDVYQFKFEEKNYITIVVPRSYDDLVSTSSGKYYTRDGKSSVPMQAAEIKRAVERLSTYDWSAKPVDIPWKDAISPETLREAKEKYCKLREIKPTELNDESFLESIEALVNGELTQAGLIFLGTESAIYKHLGTFEYRFSWRTKSGDLVINKVWRGPIYQTIEKAKELFRSCNRTRTVTYKNKEYHAPLLDETAFNEAYINSVVHRDYAKDGMVSVDYDEKHLTITNPGTFYGGVSSENIVTHQPRHRNKALARIMMNFELVDRAGMGVKRMGLGSLKYGREFPKFREFDETIEVTMHAQALLPGIFVLAQNLKNLGLIDLYILNSVHRKGVVSVTDILSLVNKLSKQPWEDIKESVKELKQIEFCGTKKGIFIRVAPDWAKLFEVKQTFKMPRTSNKHVKLFDHLMEFEESSNEQITKLLDHNHSSQTSQFLREANYVEREGKASNARWHLSI